MQYGLIKLISATVLASTAATVACADYSGSNKSVTPGGSSSVSSSTGGQGGSSSTSGPKATGGSSAAVGGSSAAVGGSSAATGGAANCPSATLCGSGDVTGTWTVSSSCLTASGEVDFSATSIGCASAPITGGQLQVTGTWVGGTDGLYTDNTNTKGTINFTLAAACLSISDSPPSTCTGISGSLVAAGFTQNTICTPNASSGCDCQGDVDNEQGSMGVPAGNPGTNDLFATDNNLLTLSNGHKSIPYSYCVSGNTLTLSPQPTHPTLTGTIVLTK